MKLLIDLKPALDGFAGIPQETRLLFANFKTMLDQHQVDALLQHGSGYLQTWSEASMERCSRDEKVFRDSRTVASFCRNAAKTIIPGLPKGIQRSLLAQQLRWQAFREQPVNMGLFESNLFDDFIWRHFFAKSLNVEDKAALTSSCFRVVSPARKMFHQVGMKAFAPKFQARYLRLNTEDYDFFIAQTPFPARLSDHTKLVIRYHDAIPVLMPHTIGDTSFHQGSHFQALRQNVKDGALFVCISKSTQNDLLSIFPEIEDRTTVIYNIVSDAYFEGNEPRERVQAIVESRSTPQEGTPTTPPVVDDYLLMVSTLEPRKNHMALLDAWERLQENKDRDLKLVIVGSKGWQYEPIMQRMQSWIKRGKLHYLTNVPSDELRQLYQHATATICPSFAEGFDYSGIEAMRSGGIVISSDIPVHREVFADASYYFDPYSIDDAVSVINQVISSPDITAQLRSNSSAISDRYTAETILPQWKTFFDEHISYE